MKHLIKIILMLLIFAGCSDRKSDEPQSSEISEPVSLYPPEFEQVLDAHGGMDKWNSFGALTFVETSADGDTSKHIIDLRSREEVAEKLGKYKVVYTEDTVLLSPSDAITMDRAKFYKNLMFYFFGIPFVTADEGVNQKLIEPAILGGITYDRIKITFNEGVGDSPKDEYILWLDQKDHTLSVLNYSVTFFDKNKASHYNAIVYGDWQLIEGLKVPGSLTWHKWQGDSLGEERHKVKFSDIDFSEGRPSRKFFSL